MKVLLPTDFSENAFNASRYALQMFAEDEVEFVLLNTFKINGYVEGSQFSASPSDHRMEGKQQQSETSLRKYNEQLKPFSNSKKHRFSLISKNLSLVDAIQQELSDQSISLIVIGTQGSTGAYQTVYGSNTIDIMEEVKNCPILAIPADASFDGFNEIVLANGYKIQHKGKDFSYIKFLAKKYNSPIRVLHISQIGGLNPLQLQNQAYLESQLQSVEATFHMLNHVNVPIGIYCFSESRSSDLISFVNKNYSFIEKLLFKPLYKNLGKYSKTPVLVVHQK